MYNLTTKLQKKKNKKNIYIRETRGLLEIERDVCKGYGKTWTWDILKNMSINKLWFCLLGNIELWDQRLNCSLHIILHSWPCLLFNFFPSTLSCFFYVEFQIENRMCIYLKTYRVDTRELSHFDVNIKSEWQFILFIYTRNKWWPDMVQYI